jgi:protein involved in polysaccharide export with SLBB domain
VNANEDGGILVVTMKPRALTLLLCATMVACGGPSGTRTGTIPSSGNDTVLGAGDVFDVRVYGEADLSSTYQVAQDGSIDYPFIGRVQVVGLEPTEIADLLTSRLRGDGYLRSPQVSVLVKEYNSKRISVMGAVARPGNFAMSAGLTVVQAISLAGGFTALASRNGTVVTRRVNGELRRFRIAAEDISTGRADDFVMNAGDIIYIPERVF